jgi:hypothetical protein
LYRPEFKNQGWKASLTFYRGSVQTINDCEQQLKNTNENAKEVKKTIDQSNDLLFNALWYKECHRNWTKLEAQAYMTCFFESDHLPSQLNNGCLTILDLISDLFEISKAIKALISTPWYGRSA